MTNQFVWGLFFELPVCRYTQYTDRNKQISLSVWLITRKRLNLLQNQHNLLQPQ